MNQAIEALNLMSKLRTPQGDVAYPKDKELWIKLEKIVKGMITTPFLATDIHRMIRLNQDTKALAMMQFNKMYGPKGESTWQKKQ